MTSVTAEIPTVKISKCSLWTAHWGWSLRSTLALVQKLSSLQKIFRVFHCSTL